MTMMLLCVTVSKADHSWDCGECTVIIYDNGDVKVFPKNIYANTASMEDYNSQNCAWNAYKGSIKKITFEKVSHIGNYSFCDCPNLTTVEVQTPNILTSIGTYAFNQCPKLEAAPITSSVTSIGSWAFSGCTSLTSIDLPSSVETIGEKAFYSCSGAKTLNIGNGVTSIGSNAFANCSNLETVTMGSSVSSVSNDAFLDCTKVNDVYCYANPSNLSWEDTPKDDFRKDGSTSFHVYSKSDWEYFLDNINVNILGDLAGKGVPDQVTWYFDQPTGVLYFLGDGDIADFATNQVSPWNYYKNQITSVVLDGKVTSIGNRSFLDCPNLTSADIPKCVHNIGDWAFGNCFGLKAISIGSGVESIGASAFAGCAGMTDVYCYADPSNLTWNAQNNDFLKDGSTRIHVYDALQWSSFTNVRATFVGNLAGHESPDKVVWAFDAPSGTITFSGTGDMVSRAIPSERPWDSIRSDIEHAVIEKGVTNIGVNAFYNCSDLTSVDIPASVDNIAIAAFFNCSGLTSVDIPSNVTKIQTGAFLNCSNLATVNIYAPSCVIEGTQPFQSNADNRKIYVFADKVDAYQAADGWSGYASSIEPLTLTANAGDNAGEYWATYYNSLANCMVGEDTKVFKMAVNGSSLTMTKIDDRTINMGQGVVLKSTSASIPLNYAATGSATSYDDNGLLGTMTSIENPGNAFVLSKGSYGVGFYKLSDSGTIGAHKAYMTYSGSLARSFFGFEETTGIVTMSDGRGKKADVWYDLNGRRLYGKPVTKGLYILNGKTINWRGNNE